MDKEMYRVSDASDLASPALLVFKRVLESNLDQMLAIAQTPDQLRPHCKSHKTRDIIGILLRRGIRRHKCATLREAAMCIEAGAEDIVLAYQLVGPAVMQMVDLVVRAPHVSLTALIDCEECAIALSDCATRRGATLRVLVDLDTGLHRTGISISEEARRLCHLVAKLPSLRMAGFQVYDAQNNVYRESEHRSVAVAETLGRVFELRARLQRDGVEISEIVCGGSGTFPCHAQYAAPVVCSPGTTIFWDRNYGEAFPDLNTKFTPAALLLSRVISKPSSDIITLDLGTKAIASDPPLGRRGLILGLEDATTILHHEEHWTVTSENARSVRVGDHFLVVPAHVCPNANLYPVLNVIDEDGHVCDQWEVSARQRML